MKNYLTFRKELVSSMVRTLVERLSEVDEVAAENVEKSARKAFEKVLNKFEDAVGEPSKSEGKHKRTSSEKAIRKERRAALGLNKSEKKSDDSANENAVNSPGERRRPGRPSGTSKNSEVKVKAESTRGPGRPPGAKNKSETKVKAESNRGPGRPPGAKNKKKAKAAKAKSVMALTTIGDDGQPISMRGRGRPPKNGVARQIYQSTGRPRGRPSREEIAVRVAEAQQAAVRSK